jgi:hypothetical protein
MMIYVGIAALAVALVLFAIAAIELSDGQR